MTNCALLTQQVRQSAQRIAESGGAAVSGLFDLTATRLVRFAVSITRNQHDAEDAVQACLMRVVANPKMLVSTEYPWSYLLGMVRNESLVVLRKRKRWTFTPGLTDLVTRCPIDQLEQEDSFRAVWSAIRSLPIEQREVVVLKIWEDLTLEQIGLVLSVSPATVASRYRYALQKLANKLQFMRAEVSHE